MDLVFIAILLPSLFAWLSILRALRRRGLTPKLPPGPSPLPIIGSILVLGSKPHQSLARLAQTYGPVMLLKLGSLNSVVISSPEAAKEILQKHDEAFCNRTIPNAVWALDHYRHSVAWLPVDRQWRKIRKICKEKMFSIQKLDSSHDLRMEKCQKLIKHVNECSNMGRAVNIGKAAFTTSLNMMSASLLSLDVVEEYGSSSGQEFRDVITGLMSIIGQPNLVDYFPILRIIDPQKIQSKSTYYFETCFAIFDEIIHQRVEMKRSGSGNYTVQNDVLEALLEDETGLSIDDIRHLLADLFLAGSDTTSGTVEWAMSELIRNPDIMVKAKHELKSKLNPNQPVQESDTFKLPYLQAIVKETFRLHPTAPLLVPRQAKEDTQVNDYIIPKNAQILINVWAIGRDSNIWSNPEKFMPERFIDSEIDFRGQDFELAPFGGGRRICPGLPLAHRMVHLMLASLIRDFEWRFEDGRMKCEEMNMEEKFGITLQKVVPLRAIPVKG